MLRASRRYLRFFLLCVRRCFISFGFNHCLLQSRACSILHLEGVDREAGEDGMDYLPHGFDALFHDDRHWRVNHCNTARVVGVCLNLTKYVTVVCNGDEMRFSQCVFLYFFLFLHVHCSISSGISLRAVNTNFYSCYCAIFIVAIVQSPNSIIRRINVTRLME